MITAKICEKSAVNRLISSRKQTIFFNGVKEDAEILYFVAIQQSKIQYFGAIKPTG